MATITSVGSGNWSAAGTWDSGVPVNNDDVVIAAGHTVTFDVDQSGFANGIAGLTIQGGATPGMLAFKHDADGTYYLKIKLGTTLNGTTDTNRGRLLANSTGVWGETGAMPFGRKCIIDLQTTAYVNALGLDIALYCTQPANPSVRTYKELKTVLSIDTGTDTITMTAAHGWADGTAVMIRSDGTIPGGLAADTLYYVRGAAGADLKLALTNSDSTIQNITSAGTGTIQLYDGHTNTGTATMNVLDDVTGDAAWVTTDGHDHVVLVDAGPLNCDQQRLQLTTINAGSIVLSANVDSGQYPNARIYLMSRNVRLICNTTVAAQNIVNYGAGAHGGVFQCEIRSTAGTGATFYGNGINGGTGHTVNGTISGCNWGIYLGTGHTVNGTISGCNSGINGGTGHTVSGTISGCNQGINIGTDHTVSGTISGCTIGINIGTDHTVSGTISGCRNGIYAGTGYTVSGTISGCNYGTNIGTSHTVSGTISGCNYGITWGTGFTVSGTISGCNQGIYTGTDHTVSGTISGCVNGINGGTGYTVSGTISGCNYGTNGGTGFIHGATFSSNSADVYLNSGYWQGWGVLLNSAIQVTYYKHSQIASTEYRNAAVAIMDLGGTAEYIGFWTLGGFCKTAVYNAVTHGVPPVANAYIHEMTFEDNDRITWVEYAIWAVANREVSITFYGKLTALAAWTTRPSVGIYDPTKLWQDPAEALSVSAEMAANTDWQTLTVTYTPLHDRELRVRVQGIGGNAGGTGTEQLYWFADIDPAPGGGGGAAGGVFWTGIITARL